MMGYSYRFAVIALVLLGLMGTGTGCVGHLPMPSQGQGPLQVRVAFQEATPAEPEPKPEGAYLSLGLGLGSGATATGAGIDPDSLMVARALDGEGNNNGYLDGVELITGIQAYATGQPVDGRRVDGKVLIGLIQLYATKTPLGTPTPTPTPPPGPTEAVLLELKLINQHRSRSGRCWDLLSDAWVPWPAGAVRELSLSSELTDAALYHSRFMAEHDCFAHQCPGEPDLQTRLEQFGYTGWTAIGENIAAGADMETPEAVFEAWRNSPGHNRNMLTCQFEEIGIGRVYAPGSRYGWYWTTDFASR